MAEEPDTSMERSVDEGDQEVVTIGEVLQSQQEMMDDANAVLGALDDKKCTYEEGYMKRQALYSCLTCIPEAKTDFTKAGGVCLACCYNCHEGHELIELYTKRNFRCDCGNSKFPNPCNLNDTKESINESNEYNQNFIGTYCTCKRPYPDIEDTVEDEMIQCIICEDWYHMRHLNVPNPSFNYAEMTCEDCIRKHDFLLHYVDGVGDSKQNVDADVESAVMDTTKCDQEKIVEPGKIDAVIKGNDESETTLESPENNEVVPEIPIDGDLNPCKISKEKSAKISSLFWADADWRKLLCTCSKCMQVYEEQKVAFLTDPHDTVQVYEEEGKAKARENERKQQENDMKFLNSLNRVPLMNAIAGFNDLKTSLKEYLKKFAENKKVVREEDIREFFSNFDTTRKRQKTEEQHFCR